MITIDQILLVFVVYIAVIVTVILYRRQEGTSEE